MDGEREKGDFINAETKTGKNAAHATDETITERGGVSFNVVDKGHLERNLGESVGDVADPSAEFSGGAIVGGRRGLDIRKNRRANDQSQEGEECALHQSAFRSPRTPLIKEKTHSLRRGKIRLALNGRDGMMTRMIEVEVYAAGVRQPDKMMGLRLELDIIPQLRYKVDTNHDVIFMEFGGEMPSIESLEAVFRKINLEPRFVGQLPEQRQPGKKTQRIV